MAANQTSTSSIDSRRKSTTTGAGLPRAGTTLAELVETPLPETRPPAPAVDEATLEGIRQRNAARGNPAAWAQLVRGRRRLIGGEQ